MSDIKTAIMREIESDPIIKATGILLDIESTGLFKRKKTLHVRGAVHSQDQVSKVLSIARKCAGTEYEVVDHLQIK